MPPLEARPLALLAIVAAARWRGTTREKVIGVLWAESERGAGTHTLLQTLYLLRREAGTTWITGAVPPPKPLKAEVSSWLVS